MKKEFSSWLFFGLFLVVMCSLFVFAYRSNIFEAISGEKVENNQISNTGGKVTDTKLLKCSKEATNDKIKENEVITITYQDDVLNMYESEQTFSNVEKVDDVVSFSNAITEVFSKLDGITMETAKINDTSYNIYTKIIYDQLNTNQLSKLSNDDSTKEMASKDIFKKRTIGLNEYRFKLEKDGYSCK